MFIGEREKEKIRDKIDYVIGIWEIEITIL